MPSKTLAELVATAIKAGLDPSTPGVAVERATRADERVIVAPVAELPGRLAAQPPTGPVVVMIGRVFADYLEAAEAVMPAHDERKIGPARR